MYTFYILSYLLTGCLTAAHGKALRVLSTNINGPYSLLHEKQNSSSQVADHSFCKNEFLRVKDVDFLKDGAMFIKSYNVTVHISRTEIRTEKLHVCFRHSEELKKEIWKRCQKWMYEDDEFTKLENGSVYLYDGLLEPGTYEFQDGQLVTCAEEELEPDENVSITSENPRPLSEQDYVAIIVGQVGSSISIIALIGHLVTFCLVPSLRNLPGYNLASLSVAFLFGYSFLLIGQVPSVLGLFCVISGILQQNFFLVAFFCMNVMAIDVWRTLRLATQKLIINSDDVKRKQFISYVIYSWGVPFLITVVSVIVDNTKGIPNRIKPQFGRHNTCWMTNNIAKTIFFSVPAFTLFVVNGIFFILSAFIIKNNAMKSTNDQHKQSVKLNYILYVRLALLMGVTWILGIFAAVTEISALWLISDTLNSLQGLFVFLLFTCSRKVFNRIREKVSNVSSSKTTSSDKNTMSSTKCEGH